MRKFILFAALAIAAPAVAQNTDIESLSGLQFNFGNPGARALGMGGAFLALADDASAAEANPAGLTILRKPEVSIEMRHSLERQTLTTSGTFPDIERTAFTHHGNSVEVGFASIVYPLQKFTVGAYYHQPLHNEGDGRVIPQRNEFTGLIEKDVPIFYMPAGGGAVVSLEECIRLNTIKIDGCFSYPILPFVTAVDVRQRTWGLTGAYDFGKLSVGASVRYQTFSEAAFTFRFENGTFRPHSVAVQATANLEDGEVEIQEERDLTFTTGFKWELHERVSVGGVYKQGPRFAAPTFAANDSTGFAFAPIGDTTFHVPDIAGLGVSVRPIPVLIINLDAVHVKYSNLVDDFISINGVVRELDKPYHANDVIEIRVGGEYFFSTKIPVAIRAGYWRDPAHSIEYRGPLNIPDGVAAAILYPKGEAENHYSLGAGFAWPRFQIDLAYDTSRTYKVGSLSMVARF